MQAPGRKRGHTLSPRPVAPRQRIVIFPLGALLCNPNVVATFLNLVNIDYRNCGQSINSRIDTNSPLLRRVFTNKLQISDLLSAPNRAKLTMR